MHRRLALFAAFLATAAVPVTGLAGVPSSAEEPAGTTLRVGTYNTQVSRSVAEFRAGVTALADRVDVFGLQEVNGMDKEKEVLYSMKDQGWSYFRVKPGRLTPVLWRTDRFDLLSARNAKISNARWIGHETPGLKPYEPARHVVVVHLQDRVSGERLSVINVHLLSAATRNGHMWPGRPRRYALYVDGLIHLEALVAQEKQGGQVFVLGDYNAGYVPDTYYQRKHLPYRTFKRLDMRSMWATEIPANGLGTRNDALIDQVYSAFGADTAKVQFDIKHSDHRPAIATYSLGS